MLTSSLPFLVTVNVDVTVESNLNNTLSGFNGPVAECVPNADVLLIGNEPKVKLYVNPVPNKFVIVTPELALSIFNVNGVVGVGVLVGVSVTDGVPVGVGVGVSVGVSVFVGVFVGVSVVVGVGVGVILEISQSLHPPYPNDAVNASSIGAFILPMTE
jgi:hypothetical protein